MQEPIESTLPLSISPGMAILGYFIVSDRNGNNACEFDTYGEALEYMASVNGTDIETEQRKVTEHARMLDEYRNNRRLGIKPASQES